MKSTEIKDIITEELARAKRELYIGSMQFRMLTHNRLGEQFDYFGELLDYLDEQYIDGVDGYLAVNQGMQDQLSNFVLLFQRRAIDAVVAKYQNLAKEAISESNSEKLKTNLQYLRVMQELLAETNPAYDMGDPFESICVTLLRSINHCYRYDDQYMGSATKKQHVKLLNTLCDYGLDNQLKQLCATHNTGNDPSYQYARIPESMEKFIVDSVTSNAVKYVAGLRQLNTIQEGKTQEAQQNEPREMRDAVLSNPDLPGNIATFVGYAKELFPSIKDEDHQYGGFNVRAEQEARAKVPQYQDIEQFQQEIMLKPKVK